MYKTRTSQRAKDILCVLGTVKRDHLSLRFGTMDPRTPSTIGLVPTMVMHRHLEIAM